MKRGYETFYVMRAVAGTGRYSWRGSSSSTTTDTPPGQTRLKPRAGPAAMMAAKYVPGEVNFFRRELDAENEFSVRVLYMVQNNPQYMLARSPTSVPAFMVYNAPNPGSPPSIYGKTRLETCVQAINRSRCGVHAIGRSPY